MKLTVRIKRTMHGPLVVLCNEHGDILPGQTAATLRTEPAEDAPRLTVEFVVDGKDLKLIPSG